MVPKGGVSAPKGLNGLAFLGTCHSLKGAKGLFAGLVPHAERFPSLGRGAADLDMGHLGK
jgi:hypothetical protein